MGAANGIETHTADAVMLTEPARRRRRDERKGQNGDGPDSVRHDDRRIDNPKLAGNLNVQAFQVPAHEPVVVIYEIPPPTRSGYH